MRQWMLAILIVLVVPSWRVFGQPAELQPVPKPDPMPAAARVVLDRYNRTEADAKKAYAAVVAKAAATARTELERLKEAETRAGHLEAALAIKGQIEKLPEKAEPVPPYAELAKRILDGDFTFEEWKALGGKEVRVQADRPKTETKIVLSKGDLYLAAPCPTDKWYGGPDPTTYLGNGPWLKLRVLVDDAIQPGFLVEGEGQLVLSPFHTTYVGNTGAVRVKLIKVR